MTPTSIIYSERDRTLLRRAKIFAAINIALALTLIGIVFYFHTLPSQIIIMLLFGGLAIGLAVPIFFIKNPKKLHGLVTINIITILALVVSYEPITGIINGGSWPLFFIWPSIAMLILRSMKIFWMVALLDIMLFILIPQLQMNRVIPFRNTMNPALPVLWSIMLASLIVMMLLLAVLGTDEEKATRRSEKAIHELDESHTMVQKNAQALSLANQELQTALDRQLQLQQEVEKLGTPLISISERVMLLPLMGTLEAERMQRMLETVPNTIHAQHIRHLIIDFTGSVLTEPQIVQHIETFIRTIELLGTNVTLTGVSSGLALTLAQQTGTELLERSGRLTDVLHASLHPNS